MRVHIYFLAVLGERGAGRIFCPKNVPSKAYEVASSFPGPFPYPPPGQKALGTRMTRSRRTGADFLLSQVLYFCRISTQIMATETFAWMFISTDALQTRCWTSFRSFAVLCLFFLCGFFHFRFRAIVRLISSHTFNYFLRMFGSLLGD